MDLDDWQKRLEEHFQALKEERAGESTGHPIFALEHGLNLEEIEALKKSIQTSTPRQEHWLVWVVYAAEIGYGYSGDEYWQTFERKTAKWLWDSDRNWLRGRFKCFHRIYAGAKPSGSWALHFSIICWPLTHAILPRDLQDQLAQILYGFRHRSIPSEALESPISLGELIERSSSNTNSRFKNFVQETLLVGQIAAALLFHGEHDVSSLILPSTLERIIADLDEREVTRERMKHARKSAQAQFRFAQVTGANRGSPSENNRPIFQGDREKVKNFVFEPNIVLRPCTENEYDWSVLLEFPDFSNGLPKPPEVIEALRGSRPKVAGSQRGLARGLFYSYGSQRVFLQNWPNQDARLLEFEPPIPPLNDLLRTECIIGNGPYWLCKVASDGCAYGLKNHRVRPGKEYVLISDRALDTPSYPHIQTTRLKCEGVHAISLKLPESLTADLEEVLEGFSLTCVETIQVWPAGLTPVRWDGEGAVEWLSTEIPYIGMKADLEVKAFVVDMGGDKFEASPSEIGAPVFIELPKLPVGRHTLSVSAYKSTGNYFPDTADLVIQIREPRVWDSGVGSQGALSVSITPYAPTLEQMWENRVSIEVYGPAKTFLNGTVTFHGKEQTQPIEIKLRKMRLPVTANQWAEQFNSVKESKRTQNAYDSASRCEFKLTAGESGAYRLVAEREFSPLRWVLRRTGNQYRLHAINDSGNPSDLRVKFYPFQTPDIGIELDHERDYVAEGGLHVVSNGRDERAILIPENGNTVTRGNPFHALGGNPDVKRYKRCSSELMHLVGVLDRWCSARLTGDAFSERKRDLGTRRIADELFHLICGHQWSKKERQVRKCETVADVFDTFREGLRSAEYTVATIMQRDALRLADSSVGDRVNRFAELAVKFFDLHANGHSSSDPNWIAEFALRLATWPAGILSWAGDKSRVEAGLSSLLGDAELARAARMMAVAVNFADSSPSVELNLFYDDWGWS